MSAKRLMLQPLSIDASLNIVALSSPCHSMVLGGNVTLPHIDA